MKIGKPVRAYVVEPLEELASTEPSDDDQPVQPTEDAVEGGGVLEPAPAG